MRIQFPEHFIWGTSTAAAQVESAGEHPWNGVIAKDGYVFGRTTDHEKRRSEDVALIAALSKEYRCGVDWSRLQPEPYGKFVPEVVSEYRQFFAELRERGVSIMLVLHHFCHPNWFEKKGGWTTEDNIPFYVDYARQCLKHFGEYVSHWNTFNEPNVYAMNAFMLGNFPPFKKGRYFLANRVLDHMGKAHDIVALLIREKTKKQPIGISLNTALFEGANLPGKIVAKFVDWWFHTRAAKPFEKCDFWGLSYYDWMLFDPMPIDAQTEKGRQKLDARKIPYDKMWGYNPQGLGKILRRFHRKYGQPIIITENGICTEDAQQRIQSIRDYLTVCSEAMADGVDIRGYFHWSTWDNFEWNLGPTYRFGLATVNFETMDRTMTEAGVFYENVIKNHGITD